MIGGLRYLFVVAFLVFFQSINIFESVADGAIYYVDYDGGSNTNSGLSTANPWKHSPGDPSATGNPASTFPQPGDTIYFKGGVKYKGRINVNGSGTVANRIYYNGQPSGWGTGKAVIDGTNTINFNACTGKGTGATECDNDNWASMYYASLPAGATAFSMIFEGGVVVPIAQLPNMTSPFKYSDVTQWRAISSGISSTQITDSILLNSNIADFYKGAYVLHNVTGNYLDIKQVSAYDGNTHTITYGTTSAVPLSLGSYDGKYHYALYNHVHLITKSGQCAIDTTGNKIYLWPTRGVSNISYSNKPIGFDLNSRSYVTIDGFRIMGQVGTVYTAGMAITSLNSGDTNGIVIQNNDIYGIDSTSGGASGAVYLHNAAGAATPNYITNNTISYVRGTRGITVVGKNMYLQNNSISYLAGTGIYYSAADGGEISGTNITHNFGVHSNGISIYGGGSSSGPPYAVDVNIYNNIVIGNKYMDNPTGGGAFTIEACDRLLFYNNLFDGTFNLWGAAAGREWLRFYNNIITETTNITAASSFAELTFKNNILGGLAMGSANWNTVPQLVRANNLYISYYWKQASSYGWSLGTNEKYNTNLSLTFANAAAKIYTHVSATGLGVHAGADLSSIFSTDILGTSRPRGSAWDIGPYKFVGKYPVPPDSIGIR